MKVGVITLGCKVNIYESNALKEALEKEGFIVGEADETCDTCSVTNMADAKSRKLIRKCVKMNPNALVCACGCYVQTNPEAKELEGVDILVGNGNKKEIHKKREQLVVKDNFLIENGGWNFGVAEQKIICLVSGLLFIFLLI